MDVIVAISTILVIVMAVGIMAYRHDREIKKQQDEINKNENN
jgi:hypothetical protein